jgi:uncharacterized protein YndB with AHSA1/START domain
MTTQTAPEVIVTRVFNAPVELVWKAWTDPVHLMRWWGPKGFTSPTCKIDFKVGGKYHFCMRSPDGQDLWSTGTYREIIPLKKIVWTDSFADKDGNVVSGSVYGMDGLPLEFHVTIWFEPQGNKTKFTVHHRGLPAGEMIEMTQAGWNESLDKLEASLQ